MATLHLDFETRSTVDLRAAGVHVYANHPTTDVWCCAWAIDDGPVQIWRPEHWRPEDPEGSLPGALLSALADKHVIVCGHNVGFEWNIIEYICAPRYGWPRVHSARLDCTAARAAIQSLPRDLEGAANALGLDVEKDMKGRRLMLQMMKPRRIDDDSTIVWWFDEDRRRRLEAYCATDVEVERALDHRLMPITKTERKIWRLDFKMNHKSGVGVDTGFVREAKKLVAHSLDAYGERLAELTGGAVRSTTHNAQLRDWLCSQGVAADSVAKPAVSALLADKDNLPPKVTQVLKLRQMSAKSSTAKLSKFLSRTSADGRMRDNLMYYGAGTGRFSGRGVQLQNLPRPAMKNPAVAGAIDTIRDTSLSVEARAQLVALMFGSPPSVVSDCLRGAVIAGAGRTFRIADYANIEGRVNAWLAGDTAKVEAFRRGAPIYEQMAAEIYGVPVASIGKDSLERFLGKTVELGAGFQMGAAKFRTSCTEKGVEIDEETAERTIATYREVNHKIVRLWYGLENAALTAMRAPGRASEYNGITYHLPDKGERAHGFLLCRLPSGRCLYYPQAELRPVTTPWGAEKIQLTYMGVNSTTRKWERNKAYGGLLTENVVQAIARDILVTAMRRLNTAGYNVVLTVHDEIIAETAPDFGSQQAFEKLMATPPPWAADCPIAVEGFTTARYRK